MSAAVRFQLVTRAGCELCEEMLAELQHFCSGRAASIELLDVDSDPALSTRYGHRVPVLLMDGEPVCHARFDAAELERLLRSSRP
ncbi:MAG TPA: glutaredoxin family protein [Steroidobacteraceae bacterium]|nr:glutaredoxin family protein [Steroidobacteraceae bacterium]